MLKQLLPFKWLRQLYNWILTWSAHRHNIKVLSLLSFTEAIFFPIPPDPLLMAMGASAPKKSLWFASVTTISSVAGALLGYLIGALFWETTQDFFFSYAFSEELFNKVVMKFQENTFLSLFIASFTPLPFKIFTVAGGVGLVPLIPFVTASLLGRGLRFFILGFLIFFCGQSIMNTVEKHFEAFTIFFGLLLVLGFIAVKWIV